MKLKKINSKYMKDSNFYQIDNTGFSAAKITRRWYCAICKNFQESQTGHKSDFR